jgi:hypothetical protein
LFREDESYPVAVPTVDGGLDINWRTPVYVTNGTGGASGGLAIDERENLMRLHSNLHILNRNVIKASKLIPASEQLVPAEVVDEGGGGLGPTDPGPTNPEPTPVGTPLSTWTYTVYSTYSGFLGHLGEQSKGTSLGSDVRNDESQTYGSYASPDEFIMADFGGLVDLQKIVISPLTVPGWGASYARNLVLETSTDGVTWDVAVENTGLELLPINVNTEFPFASRACRYARVRPASASYLGLGTLYFE